MSRGASSVHKRMKSIDISRKWPNVRPPQYVIQRHVCNQRKEHVQVKNCQILEFQRPSMATRARHAVTYGAPMTLPREHSHVVAAKSWSQHDVNQSVSPVFGAPHYVIVVCLIWLLQYVHQGSSGNMDSGFVTQQSEYKTSWKAISHPKKSMHDGNNVDLAISDAPRQSEWLSLTVVAECRVSGFACLGARLFYTGGAAHQGWQVRKCREYSKFQNTEVFNFHNTHFDSFSSILFTSSFFTFEVRNSIDIASWNICELAMPLRKLCDFAVLRIAPLPFASATRRSCCTGCSKHITHPSCSCSLQSHPKRI